MNDRHETRLTDYALGELDEAGRLEVEALLADDPKARAEVDELRRLSRHIRVESTEGKSAATVAASHSNVDLRAMIEARIDRAEAVHAGASMAVASQSNRRFALAGLLVLAASFMFMFLSAWHSERQQDRVALVHSPCSGVCLPPPQNIVGIDKIQTDTKLDPKSIPVNSSIASSTVPGPTVHAPALPSVDVDAVNVFTPSSGTIAASVPEGTLRDPLISMTTVLSHAAPKPGDVVDSRSLRASEHRLSGAGLFQLPSQEQVRNGEGRFNTEAYDSFAENSFLKSVDAPLSTFSIDVDTASYSNMRRFLRSGHMPPRGSVRIEEFINYFTYNYPQPTKDDPFSVTTEAIDCPWNAEHVLLRVGLKGKEIHAQERPATNLVFLVDVSGSMQDANKLPLVRDSLKLLVRQLNDRDRVALVVYAGRTAVVLPSTGGDRKQTILDAIDSLQSGGSTNGGAGISLAYQMAVDHFIPGGVNRVVLATDGDFNVGVTSQDELVSLIEEKAKSGVFFSALGYGMGNLKDSTLEKLADKGNGNYAYIDTLQEARKVLVEQMSGTLVTIAKDVKIQIEFNPAKVVSYRLLGYENRALAAQDFNDDKKDAGEIGAGHTVTALYELALVGTSVIQVQELPKVDPLKYQQPKRALPKNSPVHDELLTLKLRYKAPDGKESKLIERPVKNAVKPYAKAGADFKFASAVAAFGMLLRQSEHRGSITYDAVLEMAQESVGRDESGYRKEFVALVRQARDLVKP